MAGKCFGSILAHFATTRWKKSTSNHTCCLATDSTTIAGVCGRVFVWLGECPIPGLACARTAERPKRRQSSEWHMSHISNAKYEICYSGRQNTQYSSIVWTPTDSLVLACGRRRSRTINFQQSVFFFIFDCFFFLFYTFISFCFVFYLFLVTFFFFFFFPPKVQVQAMRTIFHVSLWLCVSRVCASRHQQTNHQCFFAGVVVLCCSRSAAGVRWMAIVVCLCVYKQIRYTTFCVHKTRR